MFIPWMRSLLGVSAVLLVACDQQPVEPRTAPTQGAKLNSSSARGLPGASSNRVKYRDAGNKATTGREGAASLTVRALLGRDRNVELAMTTGSIEDLDRQTGPGNTDRLQVKFFDLLGEPLATHNYNGLQNGGYARYEYPDLPRGSPIQVRANISEIDGKRTHVVTVTDVVRLRPDLSVHGLEAPPQAVPHVPVSIGATVLEVNGDLGARADCVLAVAGVEVDRATDIWVDAGSIVTCAFSHAFAEVGAHAISVAVVNVVPDDYDERNNEVTGSIIIAAPATSDFETQGVVEDIHHSYFQHSRSHWRWSIDNGSTFFEAAQETEYNVDGRRQYASQRSTANREIHFPMSLELRHVTNGSEIAYESFADLVADQTYGSPHLQAGCAMRAITSESAGRVWFEVCSGLMLVGGELQPFTRIEQYRWAGEVTYFGREYYQTWYGDEECVEGCWTTNWEELEVAGIPLPPLGSDYTLEVVLGKDGVNSIAVITVPLEPVNWSNRSPETGEDCYSWDFGPSWDYYQGTACSATGNSELGVRGAAYRSP